MRSIRIGYRQVTCVFPSGLSAQIDVRIDSESLSLGNPKMAGHVFNRQSLWSHTSKYSPIDLHVLSPTR